MHGPFVMNTADEIRQAMVDFQNGRFGESPPESGRLLGRMMERHECFAAHRTRSISAPALGAGHPFVKPRVCPGNESLRNSVTAGGSSPNSSHLVCAAEPPLAGSFRTPPHQSARIITQNNKTPRDLAGRPTRGVGRTRTTFHNTLVVGSSPTISTTQSPANRRNPLTMVVDVSFVVAPRAFWKGYLKLSLDQRTDNVA